MAIRHGQRADECYDFDQRLIDYTDPFLTPKGIQQATQTGLYIKGVIETEGFEEVILEASPFIRTMMTAAHIAKCLNIPKIKANYLYGERYNNNNFEEHPFGSLVIDRTEKNAFVEKYLDGIDFDEDKTTYQQQFKE